jgi:hypothetical protein
MSTVPGPRSWQDAGLTGPELAEPVVIDPTDLIDPADGTEHEQDEPRPDLEGLADPADVAEQAAAVPDDERDDYP